MKRAVRIDERDNVAVALARLEPGERIALEGLEVVLGEEISPGHKFALFDLPAGSRAIKYGHPIGRLIAEVKAGDWVHTYNLRSELAGPRAYTYRPGRVEVEPSPGPPPTFRGGAPSDRSRRRSGDQERDQRRSGDGDLQDRSDVIDFGCANLAPFRPFLQKHSIQWLNRLTSPESTS
ncbi:MAG: UxaA family hydrolase [Firmicutes bacterium]|nr:UxaA family hydrolase [Bacillota bacterium]